MSSRLNPFIGDGIECPSVRPTRNASAPNFSIIAREVGFARTSWLVSPVMPAVGSPCS